MTRIWSAFRRILAPFVVLAILYLASGADLSAQEGRESDPSAALAALLTAACTHNEGQFATYLTADNAKAFKSLPAEQRAAVIKRLALTDDPGRPLLSADTDGHNVLRCQVAQATAEFRFGATRARENLAFIPIQIVGGTVTEFGLVRESGGWRLLSVGLMLFDIPQLASRWAQEEIEDLEAAAVQTLRDLVTAIGTYQRAYDRLPESLAELGPAPKNEVSPEQADLINSQIAAGNQGGYRFRYRIVTGADGNPSGFEIAATPEAYGKGGRRSFLLDAGGKIHGADKKGELATPDDAIVTAPPDESRQQN